MEETTNQGVMLSSNQNPAGVRIHNTMMQGSNGGPINSLPPPPPPLPAGFEESRRGKNEETMRTETAANVFQQSPQSPPADVNTGAQGAVSTSGAESINKYLNRANALENESESESKIPPVVAAANDTLEGAASVTTLKPIF